MFDKLRFLLLQARTPDDPMRPQEVGCFCRVLQCSEHQIATHDLIGGPPSPSQLHGAEVVFLGGSGDFSIAEGGPWLPWALDTMRLLHETAKPTFASCWGFQAMARALGGEVVTDLSRAELGTHDVYLTSAGKQDPIFRSLGATFRAQMGHQDIVDRLPADAVLLASTHKVANQAFRFADKPIYCTQFHLELNRANLIERVHAYPQYIECVAGLTLQQFIDGCEDTPGSEALLPRFVRQVIA